MERAFVVVWDGYPDSEIWYGETAEEVRDCFVDLMSTAEEEAWRAWPEDVEVQELPFMVRPGDDHFLGYAIAEAAVKYLEGGEAGSLEGAFIFPFGQGFGRGEWKDGELFLYKV